MTRTEHLLTILAEECAEVAHRCAKALRFTPDEVEPGQDLTNGERILQEFGDMYGVLEMLVDDGVLPDGLGDTLQLASAKRERVEKYLRHSASVGTLEER